MTATAVIYHDNCPDGWTAAWVAYHALKADGIPQLIPASHGNPPPDLAGVDQVYIVDFSYPLNVLKELAEGRKVSVLDHHQSALDEINSSEGKATLNFTAGNLWVFIDTDRSGAGIVWDHFHPTQQRPDLVNYVEDRDLWRYDLHRSEQVNAYIRTQPYTLGAWDDITTYLGVNDMANAGQGALNHIQAYCRAAVNHAYWCEMGDRVFPIANVTYESCSDVADHMLDVFDTDMAGYFFERGDGGWQYGFRSRNGTTVHDHAIVFGGGGHPQAAGCTVDEIAHVRAETPLVVSG